MMVAISFACEQPPGNGKELGLYGDSPMLDPGQVPKASFEQLTLMDLSAVRSTEKYLFYSPPPLVSL